YAADWLSPTRLTAPDADTPPGQIGRFSFTIAADAPYGEYQQNLALVEEGITWFSDEGGPADDLLAIRIEIVDTPTPPVGTSVDPETSAGGTDSATGEPTTTSPTLGAPAPEDMSSGTPDTTGAPDPTGAAQTGDEGCGCRTPQAPAAPAALALLTLLALRRRRP
ncbi:MAG: hypothetical protein JNK56_19700, partial [Myxococcales bacterium]|nr:hypothetical protein [Myxococcales bacterium]